MDVYIVCLEEGRCHYGGMVANAMLLIL